MVKFMKMARTEEEKALKKEIILKAALRVFARKGFHKTTMTEVAEEAQLGRGTVYWHYKSKEELFFAMFKRESAEMGGYLEEILTGNIRPLEKIKKITRLITDYYTRAGDFCKIMLNVFGEATQTLQSDTSYEIQKLYQSYHQLINAMLKEGIKEGSIKAIDSGQAASV
ncbi:MAG: TetR/AcrR family transcriptional regulator, partial [Spirochaetota bacterium]